MHFKTFWKIMATTGFISVLGLGAAACASSVSTPAPQTVTQTATQTVTQTVTSTPAVTAAKNLILSSDMVSGAGGTVPSAAICVLTSQYKPGNQVVFRVRVYDPVTGQAMDNKSLSSVTITLPDGQSFKAKYSGHPAKNPADSFWAASWVIPANYKTGTLSYKATATANDGRTGTFDTFNVQPSLLTIVQ